ncbi:Fe(3+) dicitrate ABC transporter ATP-binding protein FecE [Pseudaeromonas sp. ZJS20]|uniref:Fe(3+) dicitrate ABC transporter ATP-binding protein FecE n=1 Tax=Pseudaeromonas aegiceratis TaxID=3153928 RepID=UPI00390C8CB6
MALTTEQLVVDYGAGPVLKGLDLALPPGRFTALLGPNGCGKSTLLRALGRLQAPSSGRVCWQGEDLRGWRPRAYARQVALLPQAQETPEGIRVAEAVAYGRAPHTGLWGRLGAEDLRQVALAMAATGVTALADCRLTELSGGQRQRVWLAMTLAQQTDCLLLDEPTTYLDINHQVELMGLLGRLRDQGRTLVAVLHDLNQASRYCDHLILMRDGYLVAQGSPRQVLTPALLARVFQVEAEIHPDPVAGTPMCILR